MKTVALIPAAGRGSRLGLDIPKVLVPLTENETAWSVLRCRLLECVDLIHVVVSAEGRPEFERALVGDPERHRITVSVQERPTGMGDAVFVCESHWRDADVLLVVWSDQVHVSKATFEGSLIAHQGAPQRLVIPLVSLPEPYVEFKFDNSQQLVDVLQSREGDLCSPGGLGDVGTFALSTRGLLDAWKSYLTVATKGARTNEVNFLPFLVALSAEGWDTVRFSVNDPIESLGINTPADLARSKAVLI